MKKIIYLIGLISAFTVVSCDPVEDIYNELEANEGDIVGTADYALTDDDYETLDLGFGNFSNLDDAKAMIPTILDDAYPFWGSGSIANVTFDLYSPASTERSLVVYEVQTEDYDANPDTERFDNFDDEDQIIEFLNNKYPNPENRQLVSLTYEFFNGSTNTLNNGFLYTNDSWNFIQGLTADEYALMGEGFPNFSSEDEAEAKLPIFLEEKLKYNTYEAGDIVPFMFKLFVTDEDDVDGDGSVDDRTTYSYVKNFAYGADGSWSAYGNVVEQTLQFGNDGSTWVPDNTIAYTLASEDYTFIGSQLEATYPDPTSSMANFGNFDRRNGNPAFWSDDMLLEAMILLLNNIDASAEDEQKYLVTFEIYNGANTTETISLIKTGGAWVRN
ncbi:MAG: hypothetical protein AB8B59_04010 [Maribacter sp.]